MKFGQGILIAATVLATTIPARADFDNAHWAQRFMSCSGIMLATKDMQGNTPDDTQNALASAKQNKMAAEYYARTIPGVPDTTKYVENGIDVQMAKYAMALKNQDKDTLNKGLDDCTDDIMAEKGKAAMQVLMKEHAAAKKSDVQ